MGFWAGCDPSGNSGTSWDGELSTGLRPHSDRGRRYRRIPPPLDAHSDRDHGLRPNVDLLPTHAQRHTETGSAQEKSAPRDRPAPLVDWQAPIFQTDRPSSMECLRKSCRNPRAVVTHENCFEELAWPPHRGGELRCPGAPSRFAPVRRLPFEGTLEVRGVLSLPFESLVDELLERESARAIS